MSIEQCPHCGGPLKIIAAIEEPAVIAKILSHLNLPIRAPPRSPARHRARDSQLHFMAEFQELLDFPPAPKLGVTGKLNPAKASESEMRGQDLFLGKAQCATCHQPP